MNKWKYCLAVMASCVCVLLGVVSCGDDDDPQTDNAPSLFERISANQDLSLFKQILVRSGYDKVLNASGTMTVLAPSNHALGAYNVDHFTDDLCLELAKRHVFAKPYAFSDLSVGDQIITNLLDETYQALVKDNAYKVPIQGTGFTMPGDPYNYNPLRYATITQADMACSNGSLNVIDDLIEALVVVETAFHKKEDLISLLTQTFQACHTFEGYQLKLEGVRCGGSETVHAITPLSSLVYYTESAAYNVVSYATMLISYAPPVKREDTSNAEAIDSLVAQAQCQRAFANYNLAMLWGRVMLKTGIGAIPADQEMSSQTEVYQFAYADICQAIDFLPSSDTQGWFTRDAGLMLKAELELSMGRHTDADETLSRVANDVSFGFVHPNQDILPGYSTRHLSLYRQEAQDDTDGLEQEWAAMTDNRYGYWAALKRLGKAQDVTGCYDYELLMPHHIRDVSDYPERQNPGYQ